MEGLAGGDGGGDVSRITGGQAAHQEEQLPAGVGRHVPQGLDGQLQGVLERGLSLAVVAGGVARRQLAHVVDVLPVLKNSVEKYSSQRILCRKRILARKFFQKCITL